MSILNRKIIYKFVLVFVAMAVLFIAKPAHAEIETPQKASWGVSGEGFSNSVARFSALSWSVEESNNKMFVGGKFLNVTNGVQTISQPNLARFNLDGTWDSSFRPTVSRPVLSIASLPDGSVMLGGEIREYNGQTVGSLVKIDPATGNVWPGWNTVVTGGTNVVREATLESDGWLYVAGSFSNVKHNGTNTAVTSIFRMNPDTGAIDTTWLPQVNSGVWDVSVSKTNNSVYLAGWFWLAEGSNVSAIGLDRDNASIVTWDNFISNQNRTVDYMYAVEATEFGSVWFAGTQHGLYIYDENQNMNLVKNHITNYDSRYQDSPIRSGGEYQELERVGNRIYATCHCWGSHSSSDSMMLYSTNLAGATGTHTGRISSIAAYDVSTKERIQSFNPYMAGDIGGFGVSSASDGCLWIAGGINAVGEIGNQKAGRDLVRLCEGGVATPPQSCAATEDGTNINVTWPAANGVVDYIIYRSVNGGNQYWRGSTNQTSFTDTGRGGTIIYYVASRAANGSISTKTACSFTAQVLTAPASCIAVVSGNNININWPAGNGADNYIVYRTVDGNGPYWRGITSQRFFTDSNRSGTLAYYVASKSATGDTSNRRACSFDPGVVINPAPVASCNASENNDGSITITWPAIADADRYVIYRSVDNGTKYWRGAVNSPSNSFIDSPREGSLKYYVASKFGNSRQAQTLCSSNAGLD